MPYNKVTGIRARGVFLEIGPGKILYVFDSVTAWGPQYTPVWIGAVDIETML